MFCSLISQDAGKDFSVGIKLEQVNKGGIKNELTTCAESLSFTLAPAQQYHKTTFLSISTTSYSLRSVCSLFVFIRQTSQMKRELDLIKHSWLSLSSKGENRTCSTVSNQSSCSLHYAEANEYRKQRSHGEFFILCLANPCLFSQIPQPVTPLKTIWNWQNKYVDWCRGDSETGHRKQSYFICHRPH